MKKAFKKFTYDALGEALLGWVILFVVMMAAMVTSTAHADPQVKLKDLADLQGVRDNVLIGYGLVSGLAGTGDSANGIPFTRQSLMNMLERLGVNSKDLITQVKTKNVAAVMVTAKLSSLSREGSRLDVTVSSLGDAKSLEGGLLLATPLVGADGQVYALAQGAMIVGGFQATGKDGTSISKNHPTVARIAGGALVEKESGFQLAQLGNNIGLLLRQPDFTTAEKVKDTINKAFGEKIAEAEDNSRINIKVPPRYQPQLASIVEKIENLTVVPETEARVVIDEKTGTIVMGENVRIMPVAISHSNLTIKITEDTLISQPLSFNVAGQTVAVNHSTIEKKDDDANHGKFKILKGGASLSDLVGGLNALGVKPRDVIAILQNIKAAGALQAELVIL